MYVNESIKNKIVSDKTIDDLRELAEENGMVNLWNACKEQVYKGNTSIQELLTLKIDK